MSPVLPGCEIAAHPHRVNPTCARSKGFREQRQGEDPQCRIGLVSISGGQKPAVRVQANPTALSSYGINLDDVRTALQQASVNLAKGNSTDHSRPTKSMPTTSFSPAKITAHW